jgi:hypothetical protein
MGNSHHRDVAIGVDEDEDAADLGPNGALLQRGGLVRSDIVEWWRRACETGRAKTSRIHARSDRQFLVD